MYLQIILIWKTNFRTNLLEIMEFLKELSIVAKRFVNKINC